MARYFGAKDDEALRKAVHTTVALGLAAGAALTVIGVALSPQILRWMGTPDDVIGNSIVYFRVYFMGCIAVVLYNVGASILQSVGDSRSPMLYLIAASVLNVVLDLLFVAGLHMGVGSAAFATILSQILSAALAFRKLGKATGAYAVRWRQVRFDAPTLRAVVAQGLPVRRAELGHLAGQRHRAGQHQRLWRAGDGRVRRPTARWRALPFCP